MSNMLQTLFDKIKTEAKKVIVGQDEIFELVAVSLLSGGHVLLEGVPGTAKTLVAKTLALIVASAMVQPPSCETTYNCSLAKPQSSQRKKLKI